MTLLFSYSFFQNTKWSGTFFAKHPIFVKTNNKIQKFVTKANVLQKDQVLFYLRKVESQSRVHRDLQSTRVDFMFSIKNHSPQKSWSNTKISSKIKLYIFVGINEKKFFSSKWKKQLHRSLGDWWWYRWIDCHRMMALDLSFNMFNHRLLLEFMMVIVFVFAFLWSY